MVTKAVLLTGAVAASVLCVAELSSAAVIVGDTFTTWNAVGAGPRPEATSINGFTPEVTTAGVGTWVASTGSRMYYPHLGLYAAGAGNSDTAMVSFPTQTAPIRVQADFDFASEFTGADLWYSIGFQSAASTNWFQANNFCLQIWPKHGAAGAASIYVFNGWGTQVALQTGLTLSDPLETIALEYDPTSSTYSVIANGVTVIGPNAITLTTAAPITSAGVFAQTNSPSGWVRTLTNFEVSTVPEPTTLGLLGLGSMAMLRRRQRA